MYLTLKPNILVTLVFYSIFGTLNIACMLLDDLPPLRPSVCYSNVQCPAFVFSRCDQSNNTCVSCQIDSDCDHVYFPGKCIHQPTVSFCQAPCNSTDSEICWSLRTVCRTTLTPSRCSRCNNNGECSGYPSPSWCDKSHPYSMCVNCRNDADCPVAYTCQNYKCVQCQFNAECPISTPYCEIKFEKNSCKQCLNNSHCESAIDSKCSNGTCGPCFNHSDCSHIENKPLCLNNQCVECPYAPAEIIQLKDPINNFFVEFSSEFVGLVDVLTFSNITLDDIDLKDYSYVFKKISNTAFKIELLVQKIISKTVLRLKVPCPSQTGQLYGSLEQEFLIEKIPLIPSEDRNTIENLGKLAGGFTTAMTTISGSMVILGGNPAVLWALVTLMQALYYLLFINVRYPANVQAFLAIFSLGKLDFIPNPINWIIPNLEDYSLPTPQKFEDNELNGLFLSNSGNLLLLWFLVMMGYFFSMLWLRYTRNTPRLITQCCIKIVSLLQWSGILVTFITSYTDISISSFLQLRVITFKSRLFSISSLFAIFLTIFNLALPLLIFVIVTRHQNRPILMIKRYSILFEEYRQVDSIPKYFTVILLLRRLILSIILVLFHDYPSVEIILLSAISFIFMFILWKERPFASKITNVANIFSEAIFGIVHLLILVLINDDYQRKYSERIRLDVGWWIISLSIIILVICLVVAGLDQIRVVKRIFKLFKLFWTNKVKKQRRDYQLKRILNRVSMPR